MMIQKKQRANADSPAKIAKVLLMARAQSAKGDFAGALGYNGAFSNQAQATQIYQTNLPNLGVMMNIQALMQQAQAMQKQVEANVENAKKQLASQEVEGVAGNGMVKVVMTGRHVVKSLRIDSSLMGDEPDMIEDLVAAAVNDAVRQADVLYEEAMAGATQGMGLPKGMQGLFD